MSGAVKADNNKEIELLEMISTKAFNEKSPNIMYSYMMAIRYALSGCSFGVLVDKIIKFIGYKEALDRVVRCSEFLDQCIQQKSSSNEKDIE